MVPDVKNVGFRRCRMRAYAGIDLHSSNNYVGVIDEKDRRLYRKRLPNDLDTILSVLAPFKKNLAGVVVESTFNWYWLVDGLMDHGYKVHLANSRLRFVGRKSPESGPTRPPASNKFNVLRSNRLSANPKKRRHTFCNFSLDRMINTWYQGKHVSEVHQAHQQGRLRR